MTLKLIKKRRSKFRLKRLKCSSSVVIKRHYKVLEREGGGQGWRRRWARLEEERARWSREAEWLVMVTGRGLVNNVELAT